jgi:hypothetical protein
VIRELVGEVRVIVDEREIRLISCHAGTEKALQKASGAPVQTRVAAGPAADPNNSTGSGKKSLEILPVNAPMTSHQILAPQVTRTHTVALDPYHPMDALRSCRSQPQRSIATAVPSRV